jgi:hypothetical protein
MLMFVLEQVHLPEPALTQMLGLKPKLICLAVQLLEVSQDAHNL